MKRKKLGRYLNSFLLKLLFSVFDRTQFGVVYLDCFIKTEDYCVWGGILHDCLTAEDAKICLRLRSGRLPKLPRSHDTDTYD